MVVAEAARIHDRLKGYGLLPDRELARPGTTGGLTLKTALIGTGDNGDNGDNGG